VAPIRPTVATAAANAKDVVNYISIRGSMNQLTAAIRATAVATTTDSRAASAVRSSMALRLCGGTAVMLGVILADRLAVMADAMRLQPMDVATQVAAMAVVVNLDAGASHMLRSVATG